MKMKTVCWVRRLVLWKLWLALLELFVWIINDVMSKHLWYNLVCCCETSQRVRIGNWFARLLNGWLSCITGSWEIQVFAVPVQIRSSKRLFQGQHWSSIFIVVLNKRRISCQWINACEFFYLYSILKIAFNLCSRSWY